MFDTMVLLAVLAWLLLLVLPIRSWLNGEVLDEVAPTSAVEDVTILIPARDEANYIGETVRSLRAQASDVDIVVIDDGSTDGTPRIVAEADPTSRVISSLEKPDGWSGKLWALEQGLALVSTPRVMLLDADISINPGFLAAMLSAMTAKRVQLLSIMARLRTMSFWEKLLIPAFVFFFKQVYPFRLANSESHFVAAAAGGCILLETRLLKELGGFEAIKSDIIDDCALARLMKDAGYRTWLGLSHCVVSRRKYDSLASIWTMVDRTAFCQLNYSVVLLLVCTFVMVLCFWFPVFGLFASSAVLPACVALSAMMVSYIPTLSFYRLNPLWATCLPVIGTLYLAMTWSSAMKHLVGMGVEWKGRQYR
jgi:hopene-associated glycosyltransferase HpnB